MESETKPWFSSWFDSPYYPILYQHRNDAEAEAFIRNLHRFLSPPAGVAALDLACGRGRHAAYLHSLGLDVTGLDLSPASIADAAAQHARPGLRFGVQDMREPLPGTYALILNLFTSFGYFSDVRDNERVLRNVYAALQPGGSFVMDFLNAPRILAGLVPAETQVHQGITFDIRRTYAEGIIVKRIRVLDGGQELHFEERVQAFHREELEAMAAAAGFTPFACWGDYMGGPHVAAESPRCILFFHRSTDPAPSPYSLA